MAKIVRGAAVMLSIAALALAWWNEQPQIIAADAASAVAYTVERRCYVSAAGNGESDDGPALRRAFNRAAQGGCPGGAVYLDPRTYEVQTSGLRPLGGVSPSGPE